MFINRRENINRKNICRCCGMRILKIMIWLFLGINVIDSLGYKLILINIGKYCFVLIWIFL